MSDSKNEYKKIKDLLNELKEVFNKKTDTDEMNITANTISHDGENVKSNIEQQYEVSEAANQERYNDEASKNVVREVSSTNDINSIEEYLDQLIFENNKLKEEKLLAIADAQNIVKRFKEQEVNIKKYAGESLAKNILPAIDNLRMVLNSKEELSPELENYFKGFALVLSNIDRSLAASGVELIPTTVGQKFDHNLHEAVDSISTDKYPADSIYEVFQNAYKLHERVIQFAKVRVVK